MNTWNTKKKKLAMNVAKVGVIITNQDVLNRIVVLEAVFMAAYVHRTVTGAFVLQDGMAIDANLISTSAA